MKEHDGVFQLENGYWGYRFVITVNGKRYDRKKSKDESGNRFKTKKQAIRAREQAILRLEYDSAPKAKITMKTFEDVYLEYCSHGRLSKAYGTIRKQDSLWKNHLSKAFGHRIINSISVAEINDYLSNLYYVDNRAYGYVEAFLKMFYLIFGQAYSRNYIDIDFYNKLCINKDTKIHMPKRRIDDEDIIVTFSNEQMELLDKYFFGTNAETAYMLGKYCGLRVNECYGLKWEDIDFDKRTISVNKQMQYQEGLIVLVSPKTRNAMRTMYMSDQLYDHLYNLHSRQVTFDAAAIAVRNQKQTFLSDVDGTMISSLELVNTLDNGKIQTINSMKFHSKKIKSVLGFDFKYHYLRHTYGTRLAEMNTPLHILCKQMGHASSKVTEKYYLSISQRGIDILLGNLNSI